VPAGKLANYTVTFKYIENCYYEGQLQAAGPGGKYTAQNSVALPRVGALSGVEQGCPHALFRSV